MGPYVCALLGSWLFLSVVDDVMTQFASIVFVCVTLIVRHATSIPQLFEKWHWLLIIVNVKFQATLQRVFAHKVVRCQHLPSWSLFLHHLNACMLSRQFIRLAKVQKSLHCCSSTHRSLSILGGLPSQFEVHPRTQQLIDDIDTTVMTFGHGQNYSKNQEIEVTGNDMTLESLIKLGIDLTHFTKHNFASITTFSFFFISFIF